MSRREMGATGVWLFGGKGFIGLDGLLARNFAFDSNEPSSVIGHRSSPH